MINQYIDLVLRLTCALIAGMLIGVTREKIQRPAGLKTHALISVGSAFLTELSMYVFFDGSNGDPGRITAQIVSGIGFLGAGTILKKGFSVKGLTTAATLWVTAAVGIGFGAGEYFLASLVTVFVLFIVIVFRKIDFITRKKTSGHLIVIADNSPNISAGITRWAKKNGILISSIEIENDDESMRISIEFQGHRDSTEIKLHLIELVEVPGIQTAEID